MTASRERKYVPLVKQLGEHISALQELILFGCSDEMRDGMSVMVAASSATAIARRFQVTKPAGMCVMATKSPSALSSVGGMGSKATDPSAKDDGKPTGNGCQLHSPRAGTFHNKNMSYFPTYTERKSVSFKCLAARMHISRRSMEGRSNAAASAKRIERKAHKCKVVPSSFRGKNADQHGKF